MGQKPSSYGTVTGTTGLANWFQTVPNMLYPVPGFNPPEKQQSLGTIFSSKEKTKKDLELKPPSRSGFVRKWGTSTAKG